MSRAARATHHLQTLIALALSFLSLPSMAGAEGAGNNPVTIVKIRIFIDDIRYDWPAGAPIPARNEGGFTTPAAVASFLGFAPGDSMTESELEARRRAAAKRLQDCGFFYTAQVLAVPSTGAVDGRLLVVKVKEGFPWRFGGGAYYATVGQDNAFGERKSWRVAAGYNLAGLSWEDDAVLGSPFTYTAALCYANFLGTGFLDFHEFEGEFSAGVRAHPDLYFSLGSPLRYRIFVPEGSPALALFPYTLPGLEWFPQIEASGETAIGMPGLDFVFHAVCSSGVSICTSGSAYWNAEARGSLSCTMGGGCGPVIALKLSGGDTIALAASLPIYALFDLSNDPDHPMRSGYDSMELRARWFALLNAELRIPLPRIPLGTLFSVTVAPFLFLDAALAQAPLTDAARDLEGTGVGVRIAFENPVFAYFSLSYGWNLQGEGAFRFFADSGY